MEMAPLPWKFTRARGYGHPDSGRRVSFVWRLDAPLSEEVMKPNSEESRQQGIEVITHADFVMHENFADDDGNERRRHSGEGSRHHG